MFLRVPWDIRNFLIFFVLGHFWAFSGVLVFFGHFGGFSGDLGDFGSASEL